jgi:citrate/tricarballylate utilization protein
MPALLEIHLGFVTALFLTMPYGKFVHGLYRSLALLRYALECTGEDRRERRRVSS